MIEWKIKLKIKFGIPTKYLIVKSSIDSIDSIERAN